jgi:hypothetical protein
MTDTDLIAMLVSREATCSQHEAISLLVLM